MKRFLCFLLPLSLAFLAGCARKPADRAFRIGFMPKLVGIPYFNACRRGAEEAAAGLGVELVYNGPNKADVNPQIDMLNQWVASDDFDCVAVACNEPDR